MATRSKQKALERKAKADSRPRATAKYVRISPFKVRIVLDIIKGKPVTEAVAILENTPKAASEPLLKLVNSAIANAENNMNLARNDLFIAECYADASLAKKEMGFECAYGLKDMCEDSWRWQSNNPDGYGD